MRDNSTFPELLQALFAILEAHRKDRGPAPVLCCQFPPCRV